MIKLNEKNNSDIIVNYIINKLISLTISKSFQNKIDKKIPEKYNDYVKESINNLISAFYMFHDREEERIAKDNNIFKCDIPEIKEDSFNDINRLEENVDKNCSFPDTYFYNNKYSGENDWDLIDEPKSSNLDRYSATLIKFQERNLGIEDKYNMNKEKIIEEEENSSEAKVKKEIFRRSIKTKISLINFHNHSNNTLSNHEGNNKKLRTSEISNQLKTIDLEPEKNYENRQIIKLRSIFEKRQKEKEKEKEVIKEEKEKIVIEQKKAEENLKKYIGKKINKDHNGEIIFIKSVKPNLLKNEFIFSKSKSKLVNINYASQPKPKEKDKDKEINIEKKEETDKKEKSKLQKLSKALTTKFKTLKNIETYNNKFKEKQPISLKRNVPIITSGSNFFLMNMEVGVSLKEDEKYKTGGLDFFKRYKKYSLQVYNKKLQESENSNKFKQNIELLTEPKTSTIEEMHNLYKTNYTLGNSTYDGNNSSLLNTETNIFNKKYNDKTMSLTNTNNSSLFKNYMKQANMSTYKIKNNLNLTPIINIKLAGSSLLNSFDKLNLVYNEGKHLIKQTKNLFKEKKSKKIKKYLLNDMNTFTKNLITNKKDDKFNEKIMMNSKGKIKGLTHPGKPNMKEIIQEIGLKGKLLRERKKFLPFIKSNILENENFFKQ